MIEPEWNKMVVTFKRQDGKIIPEEEDADPLYNEAHGHPEGGDFLVTMTFSTAFYGMTGHLSTLDAAVEWVQERLGGSADPISISEVVVQDMTEG